MRYTGRMASTWQNSGMHTYVGSVGLLAAIKDGLELEDEEWARLWDGATPYQRRCARLVLDPTCAPHGVVGTYTNWGCRCDLCTRAASADRQVARTREEFRDAPTEEDGTIPTWVGVLRGELAAGRELTPKGAAKLAQWEAEQAADGVI